MIYFIFKISGHIYWNICNDDLMTGYGKMEIMGKQAGQVTGQGTIHDLKSLSKRHWVGLSINYI